MAYSSGNSRTTHQHWFDYDEDLMVTGIAMAEIVVEEKITLPNRKPKNDSRVRLALITICPHERSGVS